MTCLTQIFWQLEIQFIIINFSYSQLIININSINNYFKKHSVNIEEILYFMHETQQKSYSTAKKRFIQAEKKKFSQSYFKQKRFQISKQVNPLGALTFLNNQIANLFNYTMETINIVQLQTQLFDSIKFISENIEKSYQFAKAVQKQEILQKLFILILKTIKLNEIYQQEKQNPQNQQEEVHSQIQIETNFELELQQTGVNNLCQQSVFERKMVGKTSVQMFLELLLKLVLLNKGQKQYYQSCYQSFKNQLEIRYLNGQICLQYFQICLSEKKRQYQFSSLFQIFLSNVANILQPLILDFCNMEQADLANLVIQVLVKIGKVCWIDKNGWKQILKFQSKHLINIYQNNQLKLLNLENTKKIHNFLQLLKRISQLKQILHDFQLNLQEEQCISRLFFVQIKWVIIKIEQHQLLGMQKLIYEYLNILKQFSIIDPAVIDQLKQLLQLLICKFLRYFFKAQQSNNNFSSFHKNCIWRQTFLQKNLDLKLFCSNIQILIQILYAQLSLELQELEKIKDRIPFLKSRINQIIEHDL